MTDPYELWRLWFEHLEPEAWFRQSDATDEALRERFADLPDRASAGALTAWRQEPRTALALVLALDQLPRNLYRGTARAYAYDAAARAEAAAAMARGFEAELGIAERLFLYLPLEHSEDLGDQERACSLIASLGNPEWSAYAERHRYVIRRFGRFPHRNAVLGRPSTDAEIAHLRDLGSGF